MNTNIKLIIKISLLVLILVNFQVSVNGQSVKCLTEPCFSIESDGGNVYRFSSEKKAGFIKVDKEKTQVLCQLSVDYVTAFSEGLSLALKKVGDGYLLYAIITEDYFVHELAFECYVGEFPFFSEGRLPVYVPSQKNERKYGYIDRYGELKIPMRYSKAYPFFNGRTLVKDKIGNSFVLSQDGKFFPVTSIFKNKNSEFMSHYDEYKEGDYDISQNICRPNIMSGKVSGMIYQDSETKLYGLKNGSGAVFIPAQFQYVSDFIDDVAIVSFPDTKMKLVRYCPSEIILSQKISKAREVGAGEECVCYTVRTPEGTAGEGGVLFRTYFNGKILETKMYQENSNTYSCDVVLPKSSKRVQIIVDDIIQKDLILPKVTPDIQEVYFRASSTQVRANSAGKANVVFTIENPNDESLTLTLSSTGKKAFFKNSEVTVGPYGILKITASFSGIKAKCASTVSISASNIETKEIGIQLVPYL